MTFFKRKYLSVLLTVLLLPSINVPAQTSLPQLPTDKRIERGTLGCGAAYYLVSDPVRKGYAQIALVQQSDSLDAAKRSALKTDFLLRMGVMPGPGGYLSEKDGSTVYRFGDVRFYRPEVLDSVLLYTFARMADCRAPQALIVSGDIDGPELKKKMEIFSMMVSRLPAPVQADDDEWTSNPVPRITLFSEGEAGVGVAYAGARIPRSYRNTAQALVTGLFGMEFELLLEHRLRMDLREADIPYGQISFSATRSGETAADGEYAVYVSVAPEHLEEAMAVLARALARLDEFGPGIEEYAESKQALLPRVSRRASQTPSAEDYVERCIAHFLYGNQLAPYSESLRFFAGKRVSDSTETRFFADFASALLARTDNLSLVYGPVVPPDDSTDVAADVLFRYNLNYLLGGLAADEKNYAWHSSDTAGFQVKPSKLKIKSEKSEPLSGGSLWTLSNGMRVIYKQVKGSGMFTYALQLNGGLSQIASLKEGEGGYIGELLFTDDAAGLPAPFFRDLLAANGISMQCDVWLNSMAISGDAPSDKLSLLLKSLLALADHRSPNPAYFDYYRRCQQLKGTDDELAFKCHPGYRYTTGRLPSALTPETQRKAWKFFDERFSRMNDGILILSGDLSPDCARRHLLSLLGDFRVMRGTAVRRPVDMRSLSGTTTVHTDGDPQVRILMDAEYPLTLQHYYVGQMGLQALKLSLLRVLAERGYRSDVALSYSVYPQERFRIDIRCTPMPGMPAAQPDQVLTSLRTVLRGLGSAKVDAKDLAAWKALLQADVAEQLSQPEGFVQHLLLRYAANKDVLGGYKEAIAGITAQQVSDFLQTMTKGGRVEAVSE